MYMKLTLLFLFLAVILTSCPPPATYTISGYVIDTMTGAGIPDSTVSIGDRNVQTDSSGYFSISYSSGDTISVNVFVYEGTNYSFWSVYDVDIEVEDNPEYDFYLVPTDPGMLPLITISGNLPFASVNDNATLQLSITNSNGGASVYYTTILTGVSTYTQGIATHGPDCLVAYVYDHDNDPLTDPIRGYYSHVNLSISAELDLAAPVYSPVELTGTTGDIIADIDLSPTNISIYYWANIPADPTTLDFYNGDNYPVIWRSYERTANTPVDGYETHKVNYGPSQPASSSVTLPSSASLISAPTEIVDTASVTWDSGTNTLSFAAAAGATMYLIQFEDDNNFGGFIFSAANSVVLSADFIAQVIEQGTGWDVKVLPVYSDRSISGLVDMKVGVGGPTDLEDIRISFIKSDAGNNVVADLINP